MRRSPLVVAAGLAAVLTMPARVAVQERQGLMTIAPESPAALGQWDSVVKRMIAEGTLVVQSASDDPDIRGRRHETLLQQYRGVPVFGADLSLQTEGGAAVSIFGHVYTGIDLETTPAITADGARSLAEASSGSPSAGLDPELVIWPMLDGRLALAYRVTMGNRFTYVIDAHDGRVLWRTSEVHYQSAVGTGRGVLGDRKKISATLTGGAYRSRDELRPAIISTLDTRGSAAIYDRLDNGGSQIDSDYATDSDNDWTQPAVVDGHVHMGWTYDYFFRHHNLQGIDNRNSPLTGVIASRQFIPDNAYFVPPPFGPNGRGGMFFGASSTSNAPVTVLDVVAHELMHGVTHFAVTQRTGRRFGPGYVIERGPTSVTLGGQTFPCATSTFEGRRFACDAGGYMLVSDHTGAINEGLSDVLGTGVEFAFHPAGSGLMRADYAIGEDIPELAGLFLGRPGPIRSLQDPLSVIDGTTGFGYPDHIARRIAFAAVQLPNGTLDISELAFVGTTPVVFPTNDDAGVHLNSTIFSHVYYLAVEGGTNRTSGRAVQGVGAANRVQVERVFMRAVREIFPSALSLPTAGLALRQAAADLYGSGSATFRAIDQALTAVGV